MAKLRGFKSRLSEQESFPFSLPLCGASGAGTKSLPFCLHRIWRWGEAETPQSGEAEGRFPPPPTLRHFPFPFPWRKFPAPTYEASSHKQAGLILMPFWMGKQSQKRVEKMCLNTIFSTSSPSPFCAFGGWGILRSLRSFPSLPSRPADENKNFKFFERPVRTVV